MGSNPIKTKQMSTNLLNEKNKFPNKYLFLIAVILLFFGVIFYYQYLQITELTEALRGLAEINRKLVSELELKDSRIQRLENISHLYSVESSEKEYRSLIYGEALAFTTFCAFYAFCYINAYYS